MKGTGVREKSAFIDRSVSRAGDKAEEAMVATGEKVIEKIIAE